LASPSVRLTNLLPKIVIVLCYVRSVGKAIQKQRCRNANGAGEMGMAHAERILLIKHGALGDLVQGFDAFAAMRAGKPDAHIALLTSPPFAGFAHMMPWFDEILVDPRAAFVNVGAVFRVRQMLRSNWDAIVDLQCSRRTAHYHLFLAPPATRWFGTAQGASDPYPDFAGINNNKRMLIAAEMAGGSPLTPDSVDFSWLKSSGVKDAKAKARTKQAVLIPGCSVAKPQKKWPVAHFALLANKLDQQGYEVSIAGTNTDRGTADTLLENAPFCIDMVGKTDLPALARLLSGASIVVGNDTGPVFLAARLGTPTIMIMGPETDPEMSAPTGSHNSWLRADPIEAVSTEAILDAAKAFDAP